MKRITAILVFFLCFCANPLSAQKVIWSEDFTYHYQQNFGYPWATAGSSYPWACDYGYLIGTVCFPYFWNETRLAGVACTTLPHDPHPLCNKTFKSETDAMLITPTISLIGQQHAAFSFDSYFLGLTKNGKTEIAKIEISTDSGANWTVLRDAPALPQGGHMSPAYVNLDTYTGSKIRLGFQYSDSGEKMNGWMIDNLKVFVPADHDIALTHVYPEDTFLSYYPIPRSVTLTGVVTNMGYLPVTSYAIWYSDGVNPAQSDIISGVNIAPFDTGHFTHTIPYAINALGRYKLKVWAKTANDTILKNDTLTTILHGAQFMPQKKLVVEEGTGIWNVMAPRGIVYMHALDAVDAPPTRISVHSGDTLDQKVYADYLYYLNQNFTPYFLFDRRGLIHPESFFTTYDVQKEYFGFADLDLSARAYAGHLQVDATVKPAIDFNENCRLALVLTEDGVSGTGSAFSQANGYAGGEIGPMGGFENKPDPVPASDMKYDYVARSIAPDPDGFVCIPPDMQAGHKYTFHFQTTYSPAWNFNNLKAIVLLIRDRDSIILNSKGIALATVGVANVARESLGMWVYPNPADNEATLRFHLSSAASADVDIADITGRILYQHPDGMQSIGQHELTFSTALWPSGMYFITLRTRDAQQTLKLNVLH
jgi:hypothetical protein